MALTTLKILRDTLWQQAVTGSGLPEGDVIWTNQSGERPGQEASKLWVGLHQKRMTPLNENTYKRIYNTVDPQPGGEVSIETVEHYEIEFSIHIFSMNKAAGDGYAPDLMRKLRNYLGRESTRYTFVGIGAPIVDRGSILHMPTVLNTKYESRANMALTVRAAMTDVETETYIERVTGTVTINPGARVTPFDTDNLLGDF